MPAAAPERTYATDAESPERPGAPGAAVASAEPEPVAPRRRRRKSLGAPVEDAEAFARDEEGESGPDDVDERAMRARHGGLGNGFVAAEGTRPEHPASRREAVARARQAGKEAGRTSRPEYERSLTLEAPQGRGAAPPVVDRPETAGAVTGLRQERSSDEQQRETATSEATGELESSEEAQAGNGEEGEEADDVLGELEGEEETEAEGVEEAAEEGGGGGAAAPQVAPGVLAAQSAASQLSASAGVLMQALQGPTEFAPGPEESSPVSSVVRGAAARRRESESLADDFLARNGAHTSALLALASTAPGRIFAAAEVAKASVDATVAENVAMVTGAIGAAQATAAKQAAAATALVEGQRAVSIALITATTIGARLAVETQVAAAQAELNALETGQKSSIAISYAQWFPRFLQVGPEIGDEAMAIAVARGREWLAMRNGESSLLDGPIHDNKCEARADAAEEVAKEYQKEFAKIAMDQAFQIAAGQAEVQKYVADSATQARTGLTQHHDAIVEALDTSSTTAIDQTNALADQIVRGIASSLATTQASLAQQLVAQVTRLQEYALTQKIAIDDQAGQAVAALLEGGAQAVDAFGTSMLEFRDAALSMGAPDPGQVGPALAEAQAQTDRLASTLLGQMEQGIAASELGVATGGAQASGAVAQLGASAAEQAQATADGYAASVAAMRQQAIQGFSNLRTGHQQTAEAVKASATEGFTAATTGLREAFSTLATKTVENFEKAREQMRGGLRETFPKMREQIEEQAQKAADAVQPRWKSVLKWVITIVVIVAVVALTIVSAGSLGVVGTILLGTALGAAAGAATTIGHNLVDGKKWSDGVAKAMVVGAIGGAFGGIGGALAGKVASVGLKFAIETGVDVVGGVVGDLAVGNPITVQGVLFGAAIGAGVGAGVGIAGALKGKIKIGVGAKPHVSPKVEVSVSAPAAPKSRTRAFLERTTILAKTPDVPVAPVAKPKPSVEPAAPAPKAAPEAPAAVPKPMPKAESSAPPKARPEPEAPPKVAEPEARPRKDVEARDGGKAEPGARPGASTAEPDVVAKRVTPDGHEVKVTSDGRIVRCTTCDLEPYAHLLAKDQPLANRLEAAKKNLDSPDPSTSAAAKKEFEEITDELERRLKAEPAPPTTAKGEPEPTPKAKEDVPEPSKAWDDPTLSEDEFVRRYKEAFPSSSLSKNEKKLRELFRPPNNQRLHPDTKALRTLPAKRPPADLPKPGSAEHQAWMNHKLGDPTTLPCFPAGTLVRTPHGDVAIEQLAAGDPVQAWDFERGALMECPVEAVHHNWTENLVAIRTDSDAFYATRRHPVWEESRGMWIMASDLREGMQLKSADGRADVVRSVEVIATEEKTFNLEVRALHNFLVSPSGYLVHNGEESGFLDLSRDTRGKIYVVREMVNGKPGRVIYVGQTLQEIDDRLTGHVNKESSVLHVKSNDPRRLAPDFPRNIYQIETVRKAGPNGWTKYEAHVWEQHYLDAHSKDNVLLNRERGIDPAKYEKYRQLHNPCA